MIRQAKKPALLVSAAKYPRLVACLVRAGYRPHTGMAMIHRDELESFVREYEGERGKKKQLHVQIAEVPGRPLHVYCHSEPSVRHPFDHLIEAIAQRYDFELGAKMLTEDLARAGWK